MNINVVVADDQQLVRSGFRMILDSEPDITVVAEAADGIEAVELAKLHRPDVVVMDIRMPRLDGLEATKAITEASIGTQVLVVTTFDLDEYVYTALSNGASGFLLKDAPPEDLVNAVRVVHRGDALLAPRVTRLLIEQHLQKAPPSPEPPAIVGDLTERELEVLICLAAGRSNAEIAADLFVSETTIKTHIGHILMKLALRDRVQAVVFAYQHGLIVTGQ
ncbi:MAG: response regulator transcription factor [Actinobacteria bacterium]|nr:response regulator transcription factor [Actinomycetota bacterium]